MNHSKKSTPLVDKITMWDIVSPTLSRASRFLLILALSFSWVFSGWPQITLGPLQFPSDIPRASATIVASSTVYAAAGSFTYTVSTGACTQIIDAWGAGGAGFDGAVNGGGGGGGGGAFASSTTAFDVGTQHTLVVGAGGATSAAAGEDSTVDGTVIVADGGLGGVSPTAPGAGGTVANSTGTVRNAGGSGGDGRNGTGGTSTDEGGGGGGSAGPHGIGRDGTAGGSGTGGDGGNGDLDLGGAGATADSGIGTSNVLGGGGGGGALDAGIGGAGGAPGAGGGGGEGGQGNGARGQIKVTEFVNSEGCGAAPSVTTSAASGVTPLSATLNGDISSDGGATITHRGFAWGTNSTLANGDTATTTEISASTGAFTQNVSALKAGVTYYFRAYAANSVGTTTATNNGSCTTGICSFTAGTDTTPSRVLRIFEGFRLLIHGDGRVKVLGN